MKRACAVVAAGLFLLPVTLAMASEKPLLGVWRVDTLDGAALEKGATATMRFDADGRLSGKSFCNRYGARYQTDGARIAFSAAMSTRMMCAPEMMAREQRFLSLFNGDTQWRVENDMLTLTTDNGLIVRAKMNDGG